MVPAIQDGHQAECLCVSQLAHNIEALASKGDLTFAAVGTRIAVCKRAHRCHAATADLTNP